MDSLLLYVPAVCVTAGLALLWRTVAAADPIPDSALEIDDLIDPSEVIRRKELEASAIERIVNPVGAVLRDKIRQKTPAGVLEGIQHKLVLAGMDNTKITAEAVFGGKVALTGFGVVLAFVLLTKGGLSSGTLLQAGLAVGVCYMIPETLLTRRVNDRQKRIEQELPDTIDQITVTVEAGLSFDGAIQRAGEESEGPLAEELLKIVHDMQIGMTREEAMLALLDRTDVESLRGFVFAIRQASRYGLPIANVLRVQANEMREKRRAKAEEKAMQIPVKITFPLVFCILPALFLVILGPAGIQITQSF